MDGDYAPGTLDAKLLEEGCSHDTLARNEGVRVQQRTTKDTDNDDAKPAAEDLATITNGSAAGYGAQVGDDLRHGDGVGGEEILVGQQGWVQVLAAVGHKVEASHHQDEVDEQNPVFSERNFAFRDEGSGNITSALANGDTALESLGFWQAQTENNDQHWRTGAEPEEWSPAMRSGVDEATGEGCRKQVAKCIALLEHSGNDTACLRGAVFKRCCRRIAVQTTHCDAKQGAHSEKLLVCLAEAGAELEGDKKEIVDHKRPFTTIAISSDTKYCGPDRSEH